MLGERTATRDNRRLRGKEVNVDDELHRCIEERRRAEDETRTKRRLMHLNPPKHCLLVTPADCASSQRSLVTVDSASGEVKQQLDLVEAQCLPLEQELRALEQDVELKRLQVEHSKWEAREVRLKI